MGVEQRTGPGTNQRISRVVSKSDSDHGTATTATEALGYRPRVLFAVVTSPSVTILYTFHKQVTNVSLHVFVILLWGTSPLTLISCIDCKKWLCHPVELTGPGTITLYVCVTVGWGGCGALVRGGVISCHTVAAQPRPLPANDGVRPLGL